MFHAASGFNNNVGCSTHLPDASATSIDHCKTPAPDTCAFSGKRKREVSGRDTTLTFGSADHDITATFATQLKIRRCSKSQQSVHSQTTPNRELLGGKGMFLSLMRNEKLAVPPFRCINTDTVQALEHLQLDVRPLLATLDDGHEFPHATASLVDIRQWIVKMAPSGNLSERQKRWLNELSSFIADPDFYQQISALPIADKIRTIHEELRKSLTRPDSAIIVRSSGVAEDSFGNARAGKYQSLVHDQTDILATCLKVLASAYRPAVFSPTATGMSIILQQCIECRVGGVGMSYSRTDGNGTLLIECGPGQPKAVVSGQYGITPHCYEIKRHGEQWEASFTRGNPEHGFILRRNDQGGYVEESRRFEGNPAASDFISQKQLNRLVQGCRKLEKLLLCPVDFEFAIDRDGQVWFLQVRPITCLPGGSHFSMASPARHLDQGVPVSDGCGSGLALATSGPVRGLPDNVVLFCDHGGDWLLAPEVLAKVNGIVVKNWANNDHISIGLRQAGMPCAGMKHPQWWPDNHAPQWVTLVCGTFQKESGGFLLAGDRKQDLLSESARPDYHTALAALEAWQPAVPEKEPSVARLFSWLGEQNTRLLNFLGAERLIHLYLSGTGAVQLSMHPRRREILQGCAQEIRRFIQETEAFLSGYDRFLMLGAATDPDLRQQYCEELSQLRNQLALVRTNVEEALAHVTRPFLTDDELPAPNSDFQQWLAHCHLLKNHLQRLASVNQIHKIKSVHELILWLHKCFIARLWPVASASGQGKVSTISRHNCEYIDIVDFSTSREAPLFDHTCRDALRAFNAKSMTVLNMPGCTRLSIQLGQHACTIDLLEQADGGKQRTFRLCYSEALAITTKESRHGKFQRLWFLTQTLSQYPINSGCSAPNIHFNEQTGQVLFEFTHLPDKKDLQRMFVDILSLLQILNNLDFLLETLNLDESQTQWNMAAIRERLDNPAFSEINQFALAHTYWCSGYRKKTSLINRCTHDRAIRHLVEAARIFHKAPDKSIEAVLDYQHETDRQALLRHWLLFDPDKASPLVNKYVNWLADETTARRLVSQNGHILKYLTPELRNQRAIVFAAIKSHPEAIANAPASFKNDFEIMSCALANAVKPETILAHTGPELSSNSGLFRRLLTTAVENTSRALSCNAATEYLEQNPDVYKDLLLLALEHNDKDNFYPLYHQNFRKNLLDDHYLYRKLALKALAKPGLYDNLQYFPDLNNDREVVYTAVDSDPFALRSAGPEFQADKELVKKAVGNTGIVLQFASEGLRNDEDIVLAAVKNNGIALMYASERLKADRTIVTAAVKDTVSALEYADEQFKHHPYLDLDEQQCGDNQFLAIVASKDPVYFIRRLANQKMRDDEELMQLAVQADSDILKYVSDRLRGHEPTVRLAVQLNGMVLRYASPELQANEALVKLAVRDNGMALAFASDELKDCREVVKLALQQNPLALEFAGDNCRNDPALVNIALQNNGNALQYVGDSLQNKPEIIAAAIDCIGPFAVRYIQQFT